MFIVNFNNYSLNHDAVRTVIVRPDTSSILVSGSSARVGSPDDEREGLPREVAGRAKADYQGKTVPGDVYRNLRPRPLLIVNVLWPVVRRPGAQSRQDVEALPEEQRPLVALGMSFPHFDDSGVQQHAVYKVNEVLWRSLFDQETGDDFGIDDDVD